MYIPVTDNRTNETCMAKIIEEYHGFGADGFVGE